MPYLKVTKLVFLMSLFVPLTIQAELSDSLKVPWRNPCSHTDSACLDHYANPEGIGNKKVTTTIVEGLTADQIGDVPLRIDLCTEDISKEKIWTIDKKVSDKGMVVISLTLPEKYKGQMFEGSSLIYGNPSDPELSVDLEPSVDDGKLYYSLSFKKNNVPILFEANYFGEPDDVPNKCLFSFLKIQLGKE